MRTGARVARRQPAPPRLAIEDKWRWHVGMLHLRRQDLQGRVPVLQQLLCRRRELDLVALGRAFRLGWVRHRPIGDVCGSPLRRRFPELPGFIRCLPEGYNGFDPAPDQQRVQPPVSVVDEVWVLSDLRFDAAVDAVEVCIDEHVTVCDPELGQQALDPAPGLADQDAAHDGLVLRGILTDYQHACRAVEPAAMEDWPPLEAKLIRRVDVRVRVIGAQGQKRFGEVSWIEWLGHARSPLVLPTASSREPSMAAFAEVGETGGRKSPPATGSPPRTAPLPPPLSKTR